jgi:hypothetical protein
VPAVTRRRWLAAVGLVAGVLLALASLLDWSGVTYSSRVDRGLALAAGAAVIVLALACFLWRPGVLALAIAPGALGLNMGIVNYRDIDANAYEYAAYPAASVGIGIYLVLVGAGLALIVGIVAAGWLAVEAGSARRAR